MPRPYSRGRGKRTGTDQVPEPPPPPVEELGRPVGTFQLYSGTTSLNANVAGLNMDHSAITPSTLATRIADAQSKNIRLLLPIPGGNHAPWMTNNQFDRTKWNAGCQTFNTTACRAAVASGVGSGHVLGISMMDEPFHNDWGGVMHRAGSDNDSLDSMSDTLRTIFPTCPMGYAGGRFPEWNDTEVHAKVDFVSYQWVLWQETAVSFRNRTQILAAANGIKWGCGVNLLGGGYRVNQCFNDVPVVCCPLGGAFPTLGNGLVGGQGQLCRITGPQLEDAGKTFLNGGAAWYLAWRYDATAFSSVSAQVPVALNNVRALGDTLQVVSLLRGT